MVGAPEEAEAEGCRARAALLGAYELGRTLGEGSFGKVKHARRRATGEQFAVKILDRGRVLSLRGADEQVRREITALTMLTHPNVVRLHEVAASKTKIYMVLEYVDGCELFDRIAVKRKLSEKQGRRLFQQLVDGVCYCHGKGVYHRDLKPENVLVDRKGNIKISDFGLSALPQHLGGDGLLHTTCGSPNYIAPEVLQNRGYDGSLSDIWSSGVIMYIMLVGYLPFEDRNMVVLYQKIFKGETHIPVWLSSGAQDLLKRILEPDPRKRINMAGIKTHEWFQKDYIPVASYDDNDEDVQLGAIFPIKGISEAPGDKSIYQMNAFQLIGMASSLDLSSLFEEEEVSQRKIRFTSALPCKDLFDKMESSATVSGFQVQRVHNKLKIMLNCNRLNNPKPFLVCAETCFNTRATLFQNLLEEHRQLMEVHEATQADLKSKVVSEQITEQLAQRVQELLTEQRIYKGNSEIAMEKKDSEIARLQKRLAEIDQVHQAELEKTKTAATEAVSEATKRLEDATRAHADALVIADAQKASVQLELNRARDREDAYLQELTKIDHEMSAHFPHSTPHAISAVKKIREKRSLAGPITGEWMVEDHLAALAARVKPLKVIGVDLLDAAIRAYRSLWPDTEVPSAVDKLAEALQDSEERLSEWRESAGRAGGDEVLQFVLSWYEDINLDAVQTLRAGSKWISDPEHIRRRQERAYSLVQYASVHTFHDDPFATDEAEDEVEVEDEEEGEVEAGADIDEAESNAGTGDAGADPQAGTGALITSTSAPLPETGAPDAGTSQPEASSSAP